MNDESFVDRYLEKRMTTYDTWLSKGLIEYSSRVIPVSESLHPEQCILPTERALEILSNAQSVAVQECECRSHYQRCNNPLEVCLLLDDVGDALVSKGKARHVSLIEAAQVLKKANKWGLVHLCLYRPDHRVFALCSCCNCCCHDLQIIRLFGRQELMVHSDYRAATDPELCTHCGECIRRCVFGARLLEGQRLVFTDNKCMGCGLCVSVCPVGIIRMVLRDEAIEE